MTTRWNIAESRTIRIALSALLALAAPSAAWADRSQDLQSEISQRADEAGRYETQAANAESNGNKAEACRLYRNASATWQEAASAGTSLIVETMNDSNLDADVVNENVHIMLNNSTADDERAQAVC